VKKLLLPLTVLVSPVFAQYTSLVTTRDGNQLYFSSSLRLRGTNEVDVPKIFRYSSAFDLVQQPAHSSQAFVEPEVTADGSIAGYTVQTGYCIESFCTANPPVNGVILGAYIPDNPLPSLTGRLRLSRDGKFAMACCAGLIPEIEPHLIDLRTGSVTDLQGYGAIGDGRQAFGHLANSSSAVLLMDATGPLLWDHGSITRLHFSHPPIVARMSADARTIVYESGDQGSHYELIVHEVGSGAEHVLHQGPLVPAEYGNNVPPYFQPWLSDDGSSVLFFANEQIAFELTNGSGTRVLTTATNVPEGVISATLSGDATTAYAATPQGRILRISIPSSQIEELAGPTPQLFQLQNSAAGSVNWISGATLVSGSAVPQVQVGNLQAPVIAATPSLVKFQIPWEIQPRDKVEVRVQWGLPPPFESVLTFTAATIDAQFLNPLASPFGGVPAGLAAHQDFRSYVTPTNPALPGETIHYYMSGIGPVTPALATGQRTPASGPLHHAVHLPVFCSVANVMASGDTFPKAAIRFLGLAPDYLGLYQMDLQVPDGLVNADSPLSCGFLDLENGGYRVVVTDLYARVE